MKRFVIILSFFLPLTVIGQTLPDSGFTNRTEAKNIIVNGMKEGKWVEYHVWRDFRRTDTSFYELIIYNEGQPFGITRTYRKSIRGKWYLWNERPYLDGKVNGVVKEYYGTGKLLSKTIFINGKKSVTENYDENGNKIK